MLRESAVYASVPQEEGEPQAAYVTTRHADNPHRSRDCSLVLVLTVAVIVIGLSLAVILPLALSATNESQVNSSYWSDHLQAPPGNDRIHDNDTTDSKPGEAGDHIQQNTPTPDNSKSTTTTPKSAIINPSLNNTNTNHTNINGGGNSNNTDSNDKVQSTSTTPQPISPLTPITPHQTTPSPAPPTNHSYVKPSTPAPHQDTNAGTTPKPEGGQGNMGGDESVTTAPPHNAAGDGSDGGAGGAGGAVEGAEGDVPTKSPDAPSAKPTEAPGVVGVEVTAGHSDGKSTVDPLQNLLDEIYGSEEPVKPGTLGVGDWMADVMNQRDSATVAVLAAVVGVAVTGVVVGAAWLVSARLRARKRRIRIQNVITDLQSRDKVVLLNSDESDGE